MLKADPITKVCKTCQTEKPLASFHPEPKGKLGRKARCSECMKAYKRSWYADNPNDPAKARDRALRRNYDLTSSEYEEMFNAQGRVCASCGDAPGDGISFPVDHDHETMCNRAILCHKCNKGLGLFNDDPDRLIAAAMYLVKHGK